MPGPFVSGPYAYQPPVAPKTNRLAIVALVVGLAGGVVFAVGFAIAALVQIKRRNEKGKGLAIGGLAAAAAWVVGIVAVVVAAYSFVPDRDEAGRISKSGKALVSTLKVGDCFTGFGADATNILVTALPCSKPHDGEVVAKVKLPDGSFPGRAETERQAEAVCEKEIGTVYDRSRYVDDLDLYASSPDKLAWDDGDRSVVCIMRYTGGGLLTSALTDTIDRDLTAWQDVRQGQCLRKWTNEGLLRTIACTEPHKVQVIATHEVTWGPRWPGDKAAKKKAWEGCEKRIDSIFGKREPSARVEWQYVSPTKSQWEAGMRKVICLAEAESGTLDRSILPR
ncbi:septum formation family protein [Spirillospora sp. NPDC048911]|uniref:DUF4190 domain-containing protein n=1 Tax=Spirillospora sp. NPDC048911 TaxID=3364527 RepID=UPI0037229401